jgi:ketosteroid isomerase-like protein
VDAATVKAMLEQHFTYAESDPDRAHAMYRDDAVLEFPQSGERFDGVDSFREWRQAYPTPTTPEIGEVRGEGDHWVVELTIRYGDEPMSFGVDILEFRDERIARETIYVAAGWEAPEWRARWRSSP